MNLIKRMGPVWLVVVLAVLAASCSTTPEGPTVEITDGSWTATPSTVEAGGGSFSLTVANRTATPQTFAVVTLCGGDPGALPIEDGLLDLSRDGLCGDPKNPEVALFWVVHPDYERGEGEGVAPRPLVPDSVDPAEEKTITIGGWKVGEESGTYVILSWEPGGYEAGDYAVFTITDQDNESSN